MLSLNWQPGNLNFPLQKLLSFSRLTKYENTFLSNVPHFSRHLSFFFWKTRMLRAFLLMVTETCRLRTIGGMILVEQKGSTRRKIWHSATLFILNLAWAALGSNPCLSVERLVFVGTCIVIYFYSKTKKMHNISNLFYFGTTLYMFRTVSLSINRSLRLYIQHHTIQVLWLLASKQPT